MKLGLRWLCVLLVAGSVPPALAADPPVLQPDHAWIVVGPGAKERKLLERAGFRFAPGVHRHDGQGTASVTIEFLDGFLELLYPDRKVPVSNEVAAEKFRLRSRWRTSGYSPIGIVFARTPATPEKFPFATWRVTADWLDAGTSIEMLTPRETPKAVSLSISSHAVSARERNAELARDATRNAMFQHPNGARRLTGFKVVAPDSAALPPAASWVASQGVMGIEVGHAWVLEVTLDDGAQGKTADLRPGLPLLVRY
jgi:hypothetical protein